MPRMEAEARIRELKIQKLEIDRAERMGPADAHGTGSGLHHGADRGVEDRAGGPPCQALPRPGRAEQDQRRGRKGHRPDRCQGRGP